MFVCENCKGDFYPSHSSAKYVKPKFCSRSCKTIVQMKGYRSKEELEKDILEVIVSADCYQTVQDVTKALKISSKTLNKFKISISLLNKNAGMRKPSSVFESKIQDYLLKIFGSDNVLSQATFDTLKSPKDKYLRFDFLIESLKTIVEADGTQHTLENHYMSSDYTRQCDNIKNNWCVENNYNLIRIPYSKKVDLEYVKKYLGLL